MSPRPVDFPGVSTSYGAFRLSDSERNDAVGALSAALAEGRLTMDEFDKRCRGVAAAQLRADLEPLFRDIPQSPASPAVYEAAPSGEVYTAREIALSRKDGQKTRAGLFWLGSIGTVAGALAIPDPAIGVSVLLLIPALFVLLYVLKVGPDSWYTPSLRQLERKRRELVRIQQLEIAAANAHEEARRRAARKQQMSQLTDDALDAAHRTVKRFTGK